MPTTFTPKYAVLGHAAATVLYEIIEPLGMIRSGYSFIDPDGKPRTTYWPDADLFESFAEASDEANRRSATPAETEAMCREQGYGLGRYTGD